MRSFRSRLLTSISAAALAMPLAATGVQAIEVVVLDQVNRAGQGVGLSFESLTGESLAATAAAIGNSAAFNVEGEDDAAALVLDQVNDVGTNVTGIDFGVGDGGVAQVAHVGLEDVDLAAGSAHGLDLTAAAIGNSLSGSGEGTVVDLRIAQQNGNAEGVPGALDGQIASIGGFTLIGGHVGGDAIIGGLESSLSAAAIGNSFSLAAGAIGTGDDFDVITQANYSAQIANIGLGPLAVQPAGAGAALDATAAALGNSLTLDAQTGELFLDNVGQVNTGMSEGASFGQLAIVGIESVNADGAAELPVGVAAPTHEPFDLGIVGAALGNSASLAAGRDVLLDSVVQDNLNWQAVIVGTGEANGLGGLEQTAVAIGNSLSIAAGGNLAFENEGEGGIGQISHAAGAVLTDAAQAGALLIGTTGLAGDLDVTAAAIGNSLSIDVEGDIALGEGSLIHQATGGGQLAGLSAGRIDGIEDLSATVVAIGNTATVAAGGGIDLGSHGAITQENQAGGQAAALELGELNGAGDASVTLAAIGNSLSLDAGGELAGVAEISQLNEAGQSALFPLDGTLGGFASLDSTLVAMGNSLSLGAGSFAGTGTLGIAQDNHGAQEVTIGLAGRMLGAVSATTATIGNSASVTIR